MDSYPFSLAQIRALVLIQIKIQGNLKTLLKFSLFMSDFNLSSEYATTSPVAVTVPVVAIVNKTVELFL